MTTVPAPELRDRVLAAARMVRPPGRALPDLPELSPVQAFRQAADAFGALLTALPRAAWRTPVLRDLDVQGLVGHLTGVEQDLQRALAGELGVANADHVASTQAAAQRQAGRPPEDSCLEWSAAVAQTSADVRGQDLDTVVLLHGMRLPLRSLLVVRAFELWTHDNDIRRVAGLLRSVPDPGVLRLMTDLAVRLLPHGVAQVAPRALIDVHLVLTGTGGGTWDVAVGKRTPSADVPEVGIVADDVGFCRLVANRIEPGALGAHVTGEPTLAETVLAGAAALALD